MPISYEQARALIGQPFGVYTQQGTIELTLLEAQERPRRGLPPQFRTPLSLIFTAPDTLALNQGNYQVEHPSLGRRQWMMVPTFAPQQSQPPAEHNADNAQLRYYEVLFS